MNDITKKDTGVLNDPPPTERDDYCLQLDLPPESKRLCKDPAFYANRTVGVPISMITASMLETFLDELSKTGAWGASCARAGLMPHVMTKFRKQDGEFAEMVHEAMETFVENIEKEAHRRAVLGWEEPAFNHKTGEIMGYVRRYDSRLMERILERYRPQYRKGLEGGGGAQLAIALVVPPTPATMAEWEKLANPQKKEDVVDADFTVVSPPTTEQKPPDSQSEKST